jgi:hypothetical protein
MFDKLDQFILLRAVKWDLEEKNKQVILEHDSISIVLKCEGIEIRVDSDGFSVDGERRYPLEDMKTMITEIFFCKE